MYGKIKYIDFATKPDHEFRYDAMGNRVMKIIYDPRGTRYTFYTRDAQGNILATHSYTECEEERCEIELDELHIYGSSRLGVRNIGTP